jgi:hypothetical protein
MLNADEKLIRFVIVSSRTTMMSAVIKLLILWTFCSLQVLCRFQTLPMMSSFSCPHWFPKAIAPSSSWLERHCICFYVKVLKLQFFFLLGGVRNFKSIFFLIRETKHIHCTHTDIYSITLFDVLQTQLANIFSWLMCYLINSHNELIV